jgi:hypothetical protein
MAINGDLADEPHKTFDTILTLDFGSVTLLRVSSKQKTVSFLTRMQVPILSPNYETIARTQCLL